MCGCLQPEATQLKAARVEELNNQIDSLVLPLYS